MSLQPDPGLLLRTPVRPPLETGARPVHDLQEVMRLSALPYAEAEAGYEALYAKQKDQYQARDWRSHHYDLTRIKGVSYPVRGPVPRVLTHGQYFVVLGGGQSFGARADRPYGQILATECGMDCLNLSRGGMSAEWLAARFQKELQRWTAEAAFVVVEALGVSEPECAPGTSVSLGLACWEETMRDILDLIPCPAVLLYFSRRSPDLTAREGLASADPEALRAVTSQAPRLVDRLSLRRLGRSVEVVECVGSEGLPNLAINRFTGGPETFRSSGLGTEGKVVEGEAQDYYASDAMHEAAARELMRAETIRRIVAG